MQGGEQALRYRRQIILPEIGDAGQARLARASVLVAGAGGLGSPAAMYLAAAGVGTIGIADGDRVEWTNLHRQPLHAAGSVGRRKTDSAAETLRRLNPGVSVITHDCFLTEENAEGIVAGYDAALGCVDTFSARCALNSACVALGKPNIFGAVEGFEGQAAVFAPPGACYRCFFRDPPEEKDGREAPERGILGPVAGTIGCVMATEAIKALLGIGGGLAGKLLLMDALAGVFRTIRVKADPECPVCGAGGNR